MSDASCRFFETKVPGNEDVYRYLSTQLDPLGRKLNVFPDGLERLRRIPNPESRIAHLTL